MDTLDKLQALGDSARYDLCGTCAGPGASRKRDVLDRWIYPAVLPDGKRLAPSQGPADQRLPERLLLLRHPRQRPAAAHLVRPRGAGRRLYADAGRGQVQGIFLSSGIAGGAPHTMDRLLATAEILRRRHHFPGYMHLKIMPGAEFAQVEAAVSLADRVSLNLEAPDPASLLRIAGKKDFEDGMLSRMRWVKQLADRGLAPRPARPPSSWWARPGRATTRSSPPPRACTVSCPWPGPTTRPSPPSPALR